MKYGSSGQRNPATYSKCRIVKQANIAPTWVLCLEFSEQRSFIGVVFTCLFPSIEWTFQGITCRWTEKSRRSKPLLQSAAVSWSRVLTVRVTLVHQRSYIAEPVVAMFAIADISSIATFVGAPCLIYILSVIIFRVFLSRDNIFCFRFSVANDSFLPLLIRFLIFLLRLSIFWVHRDLSPTTYYICVSGRDQEGYIFGWRPRGIAFTFSTFVDAVCDNSVGGSDDDDDWDEFSAGTEITGIAAASSKPRPENYHRNVSCSRFHW